MKRLLISILAVMMVFTLAAGGVCSAQTEEAAVRVEEAGEEFLAQKDAFEEFIDDDTEYQIKVVFSANVVVKDFKYFETTITEVDKDGKEVFDVIKELYSADELSPERPLVIRMSFPGSMPSRGISYVDENGTTRYFAVCMSGEDGSIFLYEFSK
ncbi:MAG: hypothetical protein GX256_09425 [Fretibacterium sp.]|nr:hypothetical protein [Fretibacterium sp.]